MFDILCQFKNERCLCQWCEEPCNNGLTCHECDQAQHANHDIYMCTGFVGTYPWGTHSDEINERARKLIEERVNQ